MYIHILLSFVWREKGKNGREGTRREIVRSFRKNRKYRGYRVVTNASRLSVERPA